MNQVVSTLLRLASAELLNAFCCIKEHVICAMPYSN